MVTKEEAEDLEGDAREQNESELWMTERRKRLTASRIGSVAKMKRTTKRSSIRFNRFFTVHLEEMQQHDMESKWKM